MRFKELNEAPTFVQNWLDDRAMNKKIKGINDLAYRNWRAQAKLIQKIPNANDPNTYYAYLKKHLEQFYGSPLTKTDLSNIQAPSQVSDSNVKNFINNATILYLQKQAGFEPAQATTQPAAQAAPYGTASGVKPSNINVKYGQTPPATAAKPMSYSGTVKGTLGGAPTASTATIGIPTTKAAPAATAPAAKPRVSVRAATGPATTTPAATPPAAQTSVPVNFSSVQQALGNLSKREKQRLLTQLLSQLGTAVK